MTEPQTKPQTKPQPASKTETALIVCPGRGVYNTGELGYLQRWHGGGGALVAALDTLRAENGQEAISALDGAERFEPGRHMTGDNASLLIHACAMADIAAIDRGRFEVVAVTGNSMGWYLTLGAAGALASMDAARLVNTMGTLMHAEGRGGQILYPLVDEQWRPDPDRERLVSGALARVAGSPGAEVHISIRLGGFVVLAANEEGLRLLAETLPKHERYPMRLPYHAAFHSPLLAHIPETAQARLPAALFGQAAVPMVDGFGRIWSPKAYEPAALHAYTLGPQITETYDFTAAVQTAVKEFAPDRIVIPGPGTTLGAPTAQALIAMNWRGLASKADFQARQETDPLILSMAMPEQRALATGGATGAATGGA